MGICVCVCVCVNKAQITRNDTLEEKKEKEYRPCKIKIHCRTTKRPNNTLQNKNLERDPELSTEMKELIHTVTQQFSSKLWEKEFKR